MDKSRAVAAAKAAGATLHDSGDVHTREVDVLSPCALGGTLADHNVGKIAARVVAERGTLYYPDYLTDAGGLIILHYQRASRATEELNRHLRSFSATMLDSTIETSQNTGATTAESADHIVEMQLQRRN